MCCPRIRMSELILGIAFTKEEAEQKKREIDAIIAMNRSKMEEWRKSDHAWIPSEDPTNDLCCGQLFNDGEETYIDVYHFRNGFSFQ